MEDSLWSIIYSTYTSQVMPLEISGYGNICCLFNCETYVRIICTLSILVILYWLLKSSKKNPNTSVEKRLEDKFNKILGKGE